FDVNRAEAATPGLADARAQALAGQLIVDAQTHFVRDDFKQEGLLDLAKYAKQHWNRGLWGESTLARYKFENYVTEIFVDGYTIGDPLFPSKQGSYWWLDDEKLMYPFYEKIVKAGITTVCIHKGLLPADYEKSWPGVWEYATVRDVGKAAKDWPQINFVMYHA